MAMNRNPEIAAILAKTLIVLPAYNEAEALPELLKEISAVLPEIPVCVVDDGSLDDTAAVARQGGATVLALPCNSGVGVAVQAGMIYALERGYSYLLRLDADGQHPPEEARKLVAKMLESGTDLVVGTRYGSGTLYTGSFSRRCVLRFLAAFVSLICRRRSTDPTSGFWLVNRPLLRCFSYHYPSDYPEPEALALLRRQGFSFEEVPVRFRPRQAGESTLDTWGSLNFGAKVFLALFVDRLRLPEKRSSARHIKGVGKC